MALLSSPLSNSSNSTWGPPYSPDVLYFPIVPNDSSRTIIELNVVSFLLSRVRKLRVRKLRVKKLRVRVGVRKLRVRVGVRLIVKAPIRG